MILECYQLDVCPGRQAHSSSPGYCSNLKNQFVSTGFNNICEKQYTVSILQYINTNQNPIGHLLVRQDISSLQISDLKLKRLDIFIMPYHDPQKSHFGNLINKRSTYAMIQGVSVKVSFSPSMSQGLNLIKYW